MAKPPSSDQPHDAFFKAFMSDKETARDFLDIHLPADLRRLCDLRTIKLEPGSYIDEDLKASCSDVLFSMNTTNGTGYVYALIEHQSRPDKLMAFRLMQYGLRVMAQHLKANKGTTRLPLVIPLLFYHGQTSPYPYSLNWLDLFGDPHLAQDVYAQSFPLVDVTITSDEEIMQHRRVALLEFVQKHIRDTDMGVHLRPLASLLGRGYNSDDQVKLFGKYLTKAGNAKEAGRFLNSLATLAPEHEEALMTIADQLRQEGRQKGHMEGRMEGREEAARETALKMLMKGIDRQTIIDVTGLSSADLDELEN